VGILALALWALHAELRHVHYHELVTELRGIPRAKIAIAVGLTLLSYLTLTCYDALGFAYLGRRLAWRRIGLASFLGYAFSHNLGFAALTGPAVRYRVYSTWGIKAHEVAKLFAFCGTTYWLGFLAISGLTFTFHPLALPADFHLSSVPLRLIGLALVSLLLLFLYWTGVRRRSLSFRSWTFHAPSLRLSIAGLGLSILDWTLAAGVLYVLLPAPSAVSLFGFLGYFLLAQLIGVLCHVPGGVGVFETLILLFLKSHAPAPAILGALIAYRAIYYLFPLAIAMTLLALHELFRNRTFVRRLWTAAEDWAAPWAPSLLALTMLLSGAILLFSGASPAMADRLQWLRWAIPLPLIELSHFLGSLVGATLLILARAIQRRSIAAYYGASAALALGVIVSLGKGWDYEEAVVLSLALLALLPSRRHFYRRASIAHLRFTPGWIAMIAGVVLCTLWLVLFAYRHVEYRNDLWWQFSLHGDASRSLRALVGAGAIFLIYATARLLGPARAIAHVSSRNQLGAAEAIIASSPRADANLALLGDKSLLFNSERSAFVMYAVSGRSWISMGDPVGPVEQRREMAWAFHEQCDICGDMTVFYEIPESSVATYTEMGLSVAKIGEDARVPLTTFSLQGAERRELRRTHNRLTKSGHVFHVGPPSDVASMLPELRSVSDAWLAGKRTREKGFSIGYFDAAYLERCPIATIRLDSRLIAFANLWRGAERTELSVDLMRFHPDAPNGAMDFLFSELMRWGNAEGFQWFGLGMAPLAGLDQHPLSPVWNRIGAAVYRHGEHFYNFQGLRAYKAKFHPDWSPRYLAYPGGLTLPRVLFDIGTLTSRGITGVISR